MRRNQKGFSAVEGLLIVLVLAVVGFGGYYVWSQQKNKQESKSETAVPTTKETLDPTQDEDAERISMIGFSYKIPKEFKKADIKDCLGFDDVDSKGTTFYVTEDYAYEETDITYNITSGACISVTVSSEPTDLAQKQKDLTASGGEEYMRDFSLVSNKNDVRVFKSQQGHWHAYYNSVVANDKGSIEFSYTEQVKESASIWDIQKPQLYSAYEAMIEDIKEE